MANVFGKSRKDAPESENVDPTPEAESVSEEVDAPPADLELSGPYDISEAREDGVVRIDFGSLKIPGVEGMNVNLEVDEQTDAVAAITVVLGEGGIQLQPFAAPRSGGFWEEVRGELTNGITSSGGAVDAVDGRFGVELKATVPAMSEDGEHGLQNVRFLGVDGNRWMLRGVLLGAAAEDARAAEVFEDIFAGCIVDRGNQPMAPGEMLPLQLPDDAVSNEEVAGEERPPLDPFERGPEITEIR